MGDWVADRKGGEGCSDTSEASEPYSCFGSSVASNSTARNEGLSISCTGCSIAPGPDGSWGMPGLSSLMPISWIPPSKSRGFSLRTQAAKGDLLTLSCLGPSEPRIS